MRFKPITVVNKYHRLAGEYIGRGSPLGNPFPIQGTDTRAIVIEKYRHWLRDQIDSGNEVVINELQRLAEIAMQRPLSLQCFCKPQPCHGDVIKEVIETALRKA